LFIVVLGLGFVEQVFFMVDSLPVTQPMGVKALRDHL